MTVSPSEAALVGRENNRLRVSRLAPAGALLALAGAALFFNEAVRGAEASISTLLLGLWPPFDVYSWRDQVILAVGDGEYLALRITAECTSLIVLVPLIMADTAIILSTRASTGRSLYALCAAAVIVFAANIIRVLVIVVGAYAFGAVGYGWTHTLAGTAIIAAATVAGGILMLRILKNGAN